MTTRTANLLHAITPNTAQPHQVLTVTAEAVSLADLYAAAAGGPPHHGSEILRVQTVGAALRATVDGTTAPAADTGFLIGDGWESYMTRAEFFAMQVFAPDGAAKVQVAGYSL